MKFEPLVVPETRPSQLPMIGFVALLPLLFLVPITHDAIWQIWIGREMLHGARLYTDIIEINPPLWFWMAIPQAAVAELLGLSARVVVIGFFLGAIACSALLSPARYRLPLLIAFTILPLRDFGQREHFTLIATAPYVFLIAARSSGVPVKHPWLIGAFAAVGIALKPYFVVMPVVLELLVWSKSRFRPEALAMAVSAIAYAVSVFVFAPNYLTEIVPMIRQAYGAFEGKSTNALCFLAFGLAAVGAVGRKGTPTTRALALAALAFLSAVIIQAKGWSYHTIPARGFLFLAIVIELLRHRGRPWQDGLLAASAVLCLQPVDVYYNKYRAQMEKHLEGVPRGATVAVLAANPSLAWPMVEEHGLNWTLREAALWRLSASLENPALAQVIRKTVEEDLVTRPEILVIDRRKNLGAAAQAMLPDGYLDDYKPKLTTSKFKSYVLKPLPGPKPPARAPCASSPQPS